MNTLGRFDNEHSFLTATETGKSKIKVKVPEGLRLPDDYLVLVLSHDKEKEKEGEGRKMRVKDRRESCHICIYRGTNCIMRPLLSEPKALSSRTVTSDLDCPSFLPGT